MNVRTNTMERDMIRFSIRRVCVNTMISKLLLYSFHVIERVLRLCVAAAIAEKGDCFIIIFNELENVHMVE